MASRTENQEVLGRVDVQLARAEEVEDSEKW